MTASRYRALLVLALVAHRAGADDAWPGGGADEWLGGAPTTLLHFPKTGGTTFCAAAKRNGLSPLLSCKFATELALYDNLLGPIPLEATAAPPNCSARVARARSERVLFFDNERFLDVAADRPALAPLPCAGALRYAAILREPVARALSQMRDVRMFLRREARSAARADAAAAALAEASLFVEAMPFYADNHYVRFLNGAAGFGAALGALGAALGPLLGRRRLGLVRRRAERHVVGGAALLVRRGGGHLRGAQEGGGRL